MADLEQQDELYPIAVLIDELKVGRIERDFHQVSS